uniref:Uncharacterized protein n=1 Tax=Anguilla anguilla TaxID=7936 RepID=A0A0E9UGF7_ANGAN
MFSRSFFKKGGNGQTKNNKTKTKSKQR